MKILMGISNPLKINVFAVRSVFFKSLLLRHFKNPAISTVAGFLFDFQRFPIWKESSISDDILAFLLK